MKLRTCLLVSSLAVVSSLYAAPANDSVSASAELLAGPVVSASNVGATIASDEALPPGYTSETYAGSVWWHWKPVFSGWYQISTEGSSVETVLSVWSSNGDALSLVHVSGSAIQFQADSSTTYKIAVAGHGPSALGDLSLRAFYIPDPFAKVVFATFEQTAVDITSGTATSKATLTIEASRELAEGTFSVVSPAGLTVASVPFSAANRVSGFVAHGVYEVSFSLPQYISAGGYAWSLSVVNNAVNKLASQGRGALTPAGADASTLAVVNNGVVDGYAQWVAAQGGGDLASLIGGSASLEGNLSLGKFAFGGSDAQVVNGGALVRPGAPSIGTRASAGGKKHLRVEYSRLAGGSQQGVSYRVQFSDDLVAWEDATTTEQLLASNGTYVAVAVEDTIATTDAPRRFARVLVERSVP